MKSFFGIFYGKHVKSGFVASFIDKTDEKNSLYNVSIKYFYILSLSSAMQKLFVYPLDRLRTVIFTDFNKFSDPKATLNSKKLFDTIKIEGLSKTYKGFNFSLLCTLPENIAIIASFAILKEKFDLSLLNSLFIGSFLANTVLYPLDTILTRYQADSLLKKRKYMYKSVYHLIREINRLEGIKGYYKGFFTATLTNSLVTLIYLGLFKNIYDSQVVIY